MATTEAGRLSALIHDKVEQFLAACAGIDETKALCAPEGRWTPKEIVSHLCGPEDGGFLRDIQRFVEEETPDIHLIAEQTYMSKRRANMPFSDLLSEMRAEYSRIATYVSERTDEELARKAHIPLLKESSIGEYPTLSVWIQTIGDHHITFHINHLNEILSGRNTLCFTVNKERCISCGQCAADCPVGIIDFDGKFPSIDAEKTGSCIGCRHCFAICPEAAISVFGANPDSAQTLASHLPEPQQLITLIRGRRSVRQYRPEAIDRTVIDMLLQVIADCPTGKNLRQNLFTVIDNPTIMEQVRQKTMAGIRVAVENNTLPAGMEFFAGILKAWDKGRDIIFRGAPHLLVVSTPIDGPSYEADTIIALTTFDLLAQSMGIGTLWNGFATWSITKIVPDMRRLLGIPENHYLGYVMSFGKPAVEYYRTVERGPALINRVSI